MEMMIDALTRLPKLKKRNLLVLSSGSYRSGIQAIYLEIAGAQFEIIADSYLPFTAEVRTLLDTINSASRKKASVDEIASLDRKVTSCFIDAAFTALATVPQAQKKPHAVLLNKMQLWRGPWEEGSRNGQWTFDIGSDVHIARAVKAPVLTDFITFDLLRGGRGFLPLQAGFLKIADLFSGDAAFINAGLLSHAVITDKKKRIILTDSDTGPGTSLMNVIAAEHGCPDEFDRDGSQAALHQVNEVCLDTLSEYDWFGRPAPKLAHLVPFEDLLTHSSFKRQTSGEKLATITALTARNIYDFMKRECPYFSSLSAVWISGGGALNLTLMDYLRAYCDPVPVKGIEELGIPPFAGLPVALGLTVNEYLNNQPVYCNTLVTSKADSLGKWVVY
ncbi:MAG: hypothetical protein GF398_15305 [Chitinivibrionales bacterium]|nr:hypothetical protein [Chitinivibrionales bacterium]